MLNRALPLLLLLTACEYDACAYDPRPPTGDLPFYAFSAPTDHLENSLFQAVDFVNEAAGCELIGVLPQGRHVTHLQVVPDDALRLGRLGQATIGGSFEPGPHKDPIYVTNGALEYEFLSVLITHEIGHTLGLLHSDGVMSWSVTYSSTFNEEDSAYLASLCAYVGEEEKTPPSAFLVAHDQPCH